MEKPSGLAHPVTLVIGLGNPILGDDGIGWRVVEQVQQQLAAEQDGGDFPVEVDCLSLGGLSLMERLIDCQYVIIVDAVQTGLGPTGTVLVSPLENIPANAAGHLSSAHDTSLQTALQVGLAMGAKLPEQILVVGIQAQCVYDFSEKLSPALQAAIPEAKQHIFQILMTWAGQAGAKVPILWK